MADHADNLGPAAPGSRPQHDSAELLSVLDRRSGQVEAEAAGLVAAGKAARGRPPGSPSRTARAKATKEETRQRVRFTVLLLVEGRTAAYVREFFRKNYRLTSRQADRYIAAARRQLVDETTVPVEELVAQSYGYYMTVLQSDAAKDRDKLRARELADRLLGLQAPEKIARTTASGQDVYRAAVKEMSDEELRVITKAAERARSIAAGADAGGRN